MFPTRATQALGIEHPILCGGMMWVGRKELAAAVSNAGGLGIMTALSFPTPAALAQEIRELRQLTSKPFGINLTFLPTLKPVPYQDYLEAALAEGVQIFETAGRSPEAVLPAIQVAGAKVIHKCTSLKHALKAEALGVDLVSIDGFECAGHPGEEDVTSLILTPLVASRLKIPVIACGGYATGRQLAAALAMGAAGVCMGTRFFLSQECPVHPQLKQTLLQATEKDTALILRSLKNSSRVFRNPQAETILQMEAQGKGIAELAPLLSGAHGQKAYQSGESQQAIFALGQSVGLIEEVLPVASIIQQILQEAQQALGSIQA